MDRTDPTGLWGPDTLLGGTIGALAGGATGAGSYLIGAATGSHDFSWSGLGVATVSGAVGGAVAGACLGTTYVMVSACGAAGGFAATLTSNFLTGAPLQCQLLEGSLTGLVAGALGGALYPTRGFMPYRVYNVWRPGLNATRLYGQGFVGGLVGGAGAAANGKP